jgi:hypothetical protein
MAEVVFVNPAGEELSQSEIGGILNAHALPPEDTEPRLWVYRVDRQGRKATLDEPYWEQNRPRCEAVAELDGWLSVPPEVQLDDLDWTKDHEGVVGVPEGQSILSGRKLKWREDARDVVVTDVAFHPGPTGRTAGVVWYEDPSTGRQYKTSSGFSEPEKVDMMQHPDHYEGRVMRIKGFNGHGSRGATFDGWHLDKGPA